MSKKGNLDSKEAGDKKTKKSRSDKTAHLNIVADVFFSEEVSLNINVCHQNSIHKSSFKVVDKFTAYAKAYNLICY